MGLTAVAAPQVRDPAVDAAPGINRQRRITREAGRALVILGHAIEYLADEYVHETTMPAPTDPQVVAIQLLMSANRQVYYECPIMITFGERVRMWLRSVHDRRRIDVSEK